MELEEDTRKQVAEFLPKAIKRAFDSYYAYADSDWREKTTDKDQMRSKMFTEHHTACKTALGHIELLLKLAKYADMDVRVDHTHLALIKHTAREEVNAFHAEEVPEKEQPRLATATIII